MGDQAPQVLRDIDWVEYGQTVVHPLALLILMVMAVFLMWTRRLYVLVPFIVVGAILTHMQRVVIADVDFSMIRLLMIAAVLRVVVRGSHHRFEWRRMDYLILAYVIVLSLAYIALWRTGSAVVNRMGFAFETLLGFFLLRVLVNTIEQVLVLLRAMAVVFALVAVFMTVEQITQRNLFSVFGGVSPVTIVRGGRIRAQGAFSHPILAGTFGAAFLPLFWGLWSFGGARNRGVALLGGLASFVITWASSSSGPVLTLAAGIIAIALWRFRSQVSTLFKSFLVMLVVLHVVMEAPVWHLISRIDVVGGSTGWHRYYLIDQTIRRFPEWMLFGVRTTGHWGWGLNDVTNMFVLQAVNGGLGSLVLFVLVIAAAFTSVREAMANSEHDPCLQKLIWSWGAVMFAHIVSFFGVSYFGQMSYFWNMSLGMIACLPTLTGNRLCVSERSDQTSVAAPGRV